MTKIEMAAIMAAKTGLTTAQAKLAIDSIGSAVREAAGDGSVIRIPGLGNFKFGHAAARSGTAPNGAAWSTPPRTVLKFEERGGDW